MVVMVMNPLKLLQPEYGFIWKWLPPEDLAALERLVVSLEPRQKYLLVKGIGDGTEE